jgi:SAM-dependent methyltransferase
MFRTSGAAVSSPRARTADTTIPEGVRAIQRLKRPVYHGAALVVILSASLIPRLSGPAALAAFAALLVATYFAIASLIASYVVYDRSGINRWTWLRPFVSDAVTILNVHAGYDDTTRGLRHAGVPVIPLELCTADRTASIERARRLARDVPAPRFASGHLPCRQGTCDAVLFLFAAHEMRRAEERDRCFADVARTLREGGRVVVLEHLRDARTFAVFGPGALHFYPRAEWLRTASAAGLLLVAESDLTPFAHVFVFGLANAWDQARKAPRCTA